MSHELNRPKLWVSCVRAGLLATTLFIGACDLVLDRMLVDKNLGPAINLGGQYKRLDTEEVYRVFQFENRLLLQGEDLARQRLKSVEETLALLADEKKKVWADPKMSPQTEEGRRNRQNVEHFEYSLRDEARVLRKLSVRRSLSLESMGLGNGWFVAQVTGDQSSYEKLPTSVLPTLGSETVPTNTVKIGRLTASGLEIWSSKVCEEGGFLEAHGTDQKRLNDKHLFRRWMSWCIESGRLTQSKGSGAYRFERIS